MKNWKTTGTGVLAIITGVWHMVSTGAPSTEGVTAVMTGLGLIFAKDFNVTGGGI